jgi:folate-binding protein YgfZ
MVSYRFLARKGASVSGKPSETVCGEHKALTQSVGFCDLGPRTHLRIHGADRATFLHGLCTNDVRGLTVGQGCEAFLTNVQGRTIGYVYVFCGEESLDVETVARQAPSLLPALDRYIIREDVQLEDASDARTELVVAGPQADQCLRRCLTQEPPADMFAHATVQLQSSSISVRRVPFTHPLCYFVVLPSNRRDGFAAQLQAGGASACGRAALEMARIEAGSPIFGTDLSDANLPQELDRNDVALSFTKGCYLGQETVARLDALGHVNRRLRGLLFAGQEIPERGSELIVNEKTVATLTSTGWSPRLQAPLALGYVRRGLDAAGQTLDSQLGPATVIALPIE